MDSLLRTLWAWLLPIKPITALTTVSFDEMMHLLEWHGAALERAFLGPLHATVATALERFLAQMDASDA